ncbi:sensor histidine kinase [Hymenobacter psychrotolerans]|uniref:Oxygen sensor histidine kinase NreB n=1 Tax=Hymenobacter psychrotolerans DSM 18569 TaxID=1121959 RepID=A0A1M6YMB0_9BACT|nr:sensor histidine kinase [Hymenobacter psychrotolerans]SHL19398.1 ligand-binding sensor domain-containing protein [Hymenobacter psychrotolerans DSM 18569]
MKHSVALWFLLMALSGLGSRRSCAQSAAELRFETLTNAHGLTENSVYSITQDAKGFLWVGTQDGLSRYDGVGFRTFRSDARRPSSLASNFVLSLCHDQVGQLWVGTAGGLSRYNPRTGRFRTYRAEPGDSSGLTNNFIRAVYCDRQGRVWAGAEDGLHEISPAGRRFRLFRHAAKVAGSVRQNSVRALAQDRAGTLWVGTGEGAVSRLDTARRLLLTDPRLTPAGAITTLCPDRKGGLWVGSETGLLRYLPPANGATRVFVPGAAPGQLPPGAVRSLLEDQQGTIWVGTSEGLCRYEPATGTFSRIVHQPRQPLSLPDNTVQALFQGTSGLLWVGTEAGLAYTDPSPRPFGSIPVAAAPTPVWAVTSDSAGRLWIGTEEQGLVCYEPGSGQRRVFRHNPAQPGSLAQDFVRALCFGKDGRLWVGTQSQGLDCLLPGATEFVHYRHRTDKPGSLSDDFIRSLYQDRAGRLWVGTEGGLNRLDASAQRFTSFRNKPNDAGSLSNNFVRVTLQDRTGRLWIGTGGGGLCSFDPATGRFTTFRADGGNPRSLSSNFVRCLLQDQRGTLWVGTEGGGFCRLDDPAKGRFTVFRESEGLPNDVVYAMQEDQQSNIWLSTNKGLARFNPRTGQFHTFDERNGLLQDEFNAGASHRAADGRLYFGGVKGLVSFLPAAVQTNPVPPPVVLTGFRRFNRAVELPDTSITERRVLQLAPQDYFFSLEFAALNLRQAEKNRYAYMLEGFDKGWIEAGRRREATYTNLDPGQYTFRVRASNNDGVWNRQGAALRIIVTPPWYRTWWFRVGLSWAVFGLLFMAYRVRVRQLLALERVRHSIARDLHDDMGSTLSSISILSQIARNHQRQHRTEQAAAVLEQIGESSRRMLDAMDDIVWAINPAHDSLDDVAARMRAFASEVLEAHGIEFSFQVAPAVQGLKLNMRARREFFLLFKEAINNLAKYAQCRHARIQLAYEQGLLHLTVQDDGIGFDPIQPAQGGGNGLANMRSRAAAMAGHLLIETAPGQGTTLHLKVPLSD